MGWGDELMVTGHVRELQLADPRKVRIVYEGPRWHEAWLNNPRIAEPLEQGDFQEYRPRESRRRPYIADKTDRRWTWKPYAPPRGELYFTPLEQAFGAKHPGRLIIEPRLKPGASRNKDWGTKRWNALVSLAKERGLQFTQMGPNAECALPGVDYLVTPTMRFAAAVVSHARGAILPEGGLHHVFAVFRLPAVVIRGGYIGPAVTGYEEQRSLFVETKEWPLGCGYRVDCEHCRVAMNTIKPERVLGELEALLEERRGSVAA